MRIVVAAAREVAPARLADGARLDEADGGLGQGVRHAIVIANLRAQLVAFLPVLAAALRERGERRVLVQRKELSALVAIELEGIGEDDGAVGTHDAEARALDGADGGGRETGFIGDRKSVV